MLCYQTLAFLCISKIRKLFTFESALGGGEACDGHAEGRAGGVVEADLGAELDAGGLATVLAADTAA